MRNFVLSLVCSLASACSTVKDARAAPDDRADATVPDGFTVHTPIYRGLKPWDLDSRSASEAAACQGQEVGAFFSTHDDYSGRDTLHFCLGAFAAPGRAASVVQCTNCIGPDLEALFVGVVTDKQGSGVADLSFIIVSETKEIIHSDCASTTFGLGQNIVAGYGNDSVRKDVEEQLIALQGGRGLCTGVTLVDYHDRQHVRMHGPQNRIATFDLTPISMTQQ